MIEGGYEAFDDPHLYSGTTVLRNLQDIRDKTALEAYEVEISTLRAEQPLPDGEFDAAHYQAESLTMPTVQIKGWSSWSAPIVTLP